MEQLINSIIRPPRAEYDPIDDLLEQEFMLKGKLFRRRDIEVKNSRGDILRCTHYVPIVSPENRPLPCVIYCHGNSGCRADASEAAVILLPANITVFTLDFSGSGRSGGDFVTLGWNEKDDLKAVVNYLREDRNVSLIGLWGRSMGAVTSLMYGAEDPSIAGMVLDSPFSDLVNLMMELVDTYKIRLPKFTVKFAIQYMRKAIQKKASFDIMDLNTIKVAKSCFVPVLFGHAINDVFIHPHHSDRIYEAYVGDKNIIKFEGDHNSPRPQFYFDSINIFFHNVLQPPADELGDILTDSMPGYFGKGSWRMNNGPSTPSEEMANNSTVRAIEQLRSKRPMGWTKGTNTDENLCSSSSDMISFDLSNDFTHGLHEPTSSIDDDQYVEYPLDDFTGFPSNEEEEERMIMEAMMLSLKDLETSQSRKEEQPPSSSGDHSLELSWINEGEALGKEESTSTFTENGNLQSKTESTSKINSPGSGVTNPTPVKIETSVGPAGDSRSGGSSSDTDLSANTKATVTVVRTQKKNIL